MQRRAGRRNRRWRLYVLVRNPSGSRVSYLSCLCVYGEVYGRQSSLSPRGRQRGSNLAAIGGLAMRIKWGLAALALALFWAGGVCADRNTAKQAEKSKAPEILFEGLGQLHN